MSPERFIGQSIERTGFHICLELAIPGFCIKRNIPPAKGGKFIRGKLLDLLFNRFDFAHDSPDRTKDTEIVALSG